MLCSCQCPVRSGVCSLVVGVEAPRSTEVRYQDCSSRAPGPTVGAMEAAQTLSWPNPPVYIPTAAKDRPISAAGALVLSDISQVLNLGSHQQRCNSMVHTVTRRDFSSSSLVTLPLGLSCSFSPTSACVPPTAGYSRGYWSTLACQAGRS